jgi:hypothetical protein
MRSSLALLVLAGLSPLASAGIINISPVGGSLALQSGPMPGLFGADEPAWSDTSLASMHAALNADGITTDGKVTIVPADTDHGLALLLLIDRQGTAGTPTVLGHIGFDSIGNGTSSAFVNDSTSPASVTPGGGAYRIASAQFDWNSNGEGDAFAWGDLVDGNVMTYRLYRMDSALGLDDLNTFQFVTWTGGHWSLAPISTDDASFTSSNDYGFTGWVVVPGPSTLALLPMLGFGFRRRRA